MQSRKVIRDKVTNFLKSKVMKLILDFIALKAAWLLSGPIGWITNLVLTLLWNRFGRAAANWLMRKGVLGVDMTHGKIKIYKIDKAKDENDANTYWDTISGI